MFRFGLLLFIVTMLVPCARANPARSPDSARYKTGELDSKVAEDLGAGNTEQPSGTRPAPELEGKIKEFQGQRAPGIMPMDLRWERMANGKLRITDIGTENEYFGRIKVGDEFSSVEEIESHKPKANHP